MNITDMRQSLNQQLIFLHLAGFRIAPSGEEEANVGWMAGQVLRHTVGSQICALVHKNAVQPQAGLITHRCSHRLDSWL